MRILKGYSKDEQKELEDNKKFMNCNDFINIITSNRVTTVCCFIKDKYDKAEKDEQISIIRDILDFYTGNVKFKEQKYYVKLIKNRDSSYLYRSKLTNFLILGGCSLSQDYQNEFTEQEIKDIDPRYMAFAIPVEADNE